MYCIIKNFVRKLLIGRLMFNLSHYHQHLLQQSIILFVFIVKYNSGWEEMFLQKNGGGKEVDGLVPIGTDLVPAPSELLKIIRCNCQSDCSNLRCTCQKHGINCSIVCGNCKGCSCTNSETVSDDIDED